MQQTPVMAVGKRAALRLVFFGALVLGLALPAVAQDTRPTELPYDTTVHYIAAGQPFAAGVA